MRKRVVKLNEDMLRRIIRESITDYIDRKKIRPLVLTPEEKEELAYGIACYIGKGNYCYHGESSEGDFETEKYDFRFEYYYDEDGYREDDYYNGTGAYVRTSYEFSLYDVGAWELDDEEGTYFFVMDSNGVSEIEKLVDKFLS